MAPDGGVHSQFTDTFTHTLDLILGVLGPIAVSNSFGGIQGEILTGSRGQSWRAAPKFWP